MNKKFRFTDKTNIRLGFEVECFVKERHSETFTKEIKSIYKNIIFDNDGSIDPPMDGKYETYELQTPVLPPGTAMKVLEKIFAVLHKYGGTNSSCGLHVNISSNDKKRMKRFNPLPFITNPIWTRLLRDFRRTRNDYCLPVYDYKRSPMDVFSSGGWAEDDCGNYNGAGSGWDKDSCINLSNWGSGTYADSRLEIRGLGNARYHRRFHVVSKYVKKIITLFVLCCDRAPLSPFKV